MSNTIMRFLADKQTDAFKADKDKFFDYPMQAVVKGKVSTLFINDVERTYDANRHTIRVVAIHRSDEGDTIYIMTKTCVAPRNCEIDWDTVHCTTSFQIL